MSRLSLAVLLCTLSGCIFGGNDDVPEGGGNDNAIVAKRGGDKSVQPVPLGGHQTDARFGMAYPTGLRESSIVYVERVSNYEVRVGKAHDYQIRVTNLTDNPVADVVVRERMPRTFEFRAAKPAGSVAESGEIVLPVGELGPRETKTVTVTGVPNVQGRLNSCITVSYLPTLCTTTDIVRPELKLVKESPDNVAVCDEFTARYVVRNVGTGTERTVRIEDALPDGLTAVEGGAKKIVLDAGDLPAGKAREFAVRLKAAWPGRFTSAAVAIGTDEEVQSEPATTIVGKPKLEIAIAGPKSEYINKTGDYQVVVRNTGDAPTRNAVVKLTGTDGAAFVDAVVKGLDRRFTTSAIELGTLKPGDTASISAAFQGQREGAMRISAAASGTCATTTSATAETSILTIPALRLEVVDIEDPVRVGNDTTYRITVKNQGTGADTDIRVVAIVPEGLKYVSAEGPTTGVAEGNKVVFNMVRVLEPGQSATWLLRATAVKPEDARFQVELTSGTMTKPAVETEPTRVYDRP
jgi:uncharacterized repeat protein (TIGR01451 family)